MILPVEYGQYFKILITILYVFAIMGYAYLFKNISFATVFTFMLILMGLVKLVLYGSISLYTALSPAISLLGFNYLHNKRINTNHFIFIFIFQYVYYYIVYYSQLPDLFFRPFFDEDAICFDIASSNGIPITLNITYITYLMIIKLYERKISFIFIIVSVTNFVLIVIQQSRVGIIVSLTLVVISIYWYLIDNKGDRYIGAFRYFVIGGIVSLVFIGTSSIGSQRNTIELVELSSAASTYNENIRANAVYSFLNEMNTLEQIIWGYKSDYVFSAEYSTQILYTYNTLIDTWNRYGFIAFSLLVFVFIKRIYAWRTSVIPLYLLFPIGMYLTVESLFLPNYWDVILYLALFSRGSIKP